MPTKESDTEYNALFSYIKEWHMAIVGAAVGFILGRSKTLQKEFSKEPHYLIGSALLTFIIVQKYEQWNG